MVTTWLQPWLFNGLPKNVLWRGNHMVAAMAFYGYHFLATSYMIRTAIWFLLPQTDPHPLASVRASVPWLGKLLCLQPWRTTTFLTDCEKSEVAASAKYMDCKKPAECWLYIIWSVFWLFEATMKSMRNASFVSEYQRARILAGYPWHVCGCSHGVWSWC